MTSMPTVSDGSRPREWSISNRALIVSAGSKQVLAVLNGRQPLLLPPGSVLEFGDPLCELVVTSVRVIADEDGGIVCVEAEPEPGRYHASAGSARPAEWPGHLRPVPSQPPRWSPVRPGNG
jgi:hypothetical protein